MTAFITLFGRNGQRIKAFPSSRRTGSGDVRLSTRRRRPILRGLVHNSIATNVVVIVAAAAFILVVVVVVVVVVVAAAIAVMAIERLQEEWTAVGLNRTPISVIETRIFHRRHGWEGQAHGSKADTATAGGVVGAGLLRIALLLMNINRMLIQ